MTNGFTKLIDGKKRERVFLKLLYRFLNWLFSPIYLAQSPKKLYRTGRWYGFGIISLLCIVLYLLNYLDLHIINWFNLTPSQLPTGFVSTTKVFLASSETLARFMPWLRLLKDLPLYTFIPFAYLSLTLVPRVGPVIARNTLTAVLFFTNKAIEYAEWCMLNRWVSAVLLLLLTALLSADGAYLTSKYKSSKQTRDDLQRWLQHNETFINHNALAQNDFDEYEKANAFWRDDFLATSSASGYNRVNPVILLHRILYIVYKDAQQTDEMVSPDSWGRHLKEIYPDLQRITENSLMPETDDTEEGRRARYLIEIYLAKLYVKVSPTNQLTLFEAKQRYERVLNLLSNKSGEEANLTRSAARNGLGTVYLNYAKLFASGALNIGNPDSPRLCVSVRDCFAAAESAYTSAAIGVKPCSYEEKRELNNVTDLYMNIGENYESYASSYSTPQNAQELTALEVAAKLDELIAGLTRCASSPPFVPLTFVTTAQAAATSASLKIKSCKNAKEDVENAALFLNLAYNLSDPTNLVDWDMTPFNRLIQIRSAIGAECVSNPDSDMTDYGKYFYERLEQPNSILRSPKKQFDRLNSNNSLVSK